MHLPQFLGQLLVPPSRDIDNGVKITNNAGSSVQVTLYDAQGKTMLTASYPEINQIDFEVSLQVPISTAGNHWMRVEYKGKTEIKKLMVR